MDWQRAIEAQRISATLSWLQAIALYGLGCALYAGHERRKGWASVLPFYIFVCKNCEKLAKDYPHGYPDEQRLTCPHCGAPRKFITWRTRLYMRWIDFEFFLLYGIPFISSQMRKRKKA